MAEGKQYSAENISFGEASEARKLLDVVELSRKIKRKGDRFIVSQEIHLRPRIIQYLKDEGRILNLLPDIPSSHASMLAPLKTDREVVLFSKIYDVKVTSARKLRNLVREWNFSVQKNPLLLLTQQEHDLIIGSLLGDASVRQREKNSCFRFSHSLKQKEYAQWKMNLLANFPISEFREVNRKIGLHFIHAVDFSTKTHPIFNYYRNLFYKNGRKIVVQDILDNLTSFGLAVWICDDGSYNNHQGYIVLCTNAYSIEEHNLMKDFFNKKFGLNPAIGFRDGKYHYLRFKQEDSKKLISIIKPHLPACMLYKIGEKNA